MLTQDREIKRFLGDVQDDIDHCLVLIGRAQSHIHPLEATQDLEVCKSCLDEAKVHLEQTRARINFLLIEDAKILPKTAIDMGNKTAQLRSFLTRLMKDLAQGGAR